MSARPRLAVTPLRRALGYLGPYRRTALAALAGLLAVSVVSLFIPRVLQWGIDEGIEGGDLGVVGRAALLLVGLALLRGAFAFLQAYSSEVASQGVAFDMRNGIYDKLQRLSFSYHDQAQTGQLMTRVTSDVEQVRTFVGIGFLQFLSALFLLVGSALVILTMSWRLALAALSVIPFIFLVLGLFIARVRPRFTVIQERLGALNTVLQENIAGVRVVRAFAAEPREEARFERANQALLEVWLDLIRVFASSFPFIFFLANLGTLIVFWLGGRMVIGGTMSVGELVAFNTYLAMLLMPLFILGGIAAGLSRASASAARVFEVLDAEIELRERPGATWPEPLRGEVAFEDVRFRYVGAAEPVLKGLSFRARPGETVAILGTTGSGKSTVINLIPRFYDVDEGRITIDGIDVRDLQLDRLREAIGFVRQDPVLFSDTVAENIAYGRPDASRADVEAAARAAQAHDFIAAMPEGYDTPLGERGAGLSGGQRQRVAIARALLVDPRILVFDDATSAVDTDTEARIQAALDVLLAGRTAFVIAQRISTVQRADRILVLEDGRIAAEGRHDELLAGSPLYCDIVASQLLDDEPMLVADVSAGGGATDGDARGDARDDAAPTDAVSSDRGEA